MVRTTSSQTYYAHNTSDARSLGEGLRGKRLLQHARNLQQGALSRTAKRTPNRMVCHTLERAGKSAMQAISANDLKTGGIGAISRELEHEREVGLSVRGDLRYVVMEADAYQRLRECELEIALQEARADLAAGRVVYESVDDHLKRLDSMAIGPEDELQTAQSEP